MSAEQQALLYCPAAGFSPIDVDDANELLVRWGHNLGAVNRPFRSEAWAFEVDGHGAERHRRRGEGQRVGVEALTIGRPRALGVPGDAGRPISVAVSASLVSSTVSCAHGSWRRGQAVDPLASPGRASAKSADFGSRRLANAIDLGGFSVTAGRKPRPTHLKVLEGNPGKRALNTNEPRSPKPRRPTCPAWLDPEAKKVWRFIVKELGDWRILEPVDGPAIVVLAEAVVQHRKACEIVDTAGVLIKGPRGLVKNPACQIVRDSANIIAKYAAEFGMTSSARSRVEAHTGDDEDDIARRYLT